MSVYVENYGSFWKLGVKEWKALVTQALDGTGYDLAKQIGHALERRPNVIGITKSGETYLRNSDKHELHTPLDWTIENWYDEAYRLGILKSPVKRAMIEVEEGVYKSRDGWTLRRDPTFWRLTDGSGAEVMFDKYLNDISSRHKLEILHRFGVG